MNNATLTIKQGETELGTFTANQGTNATITVPTPAAQVNADWNATSGAAQILNKPTIPTVPTNVSAFTNDAGYITSSDVPAQVNADWNATSGAAQILNKPTIPTVNNATLTIQKNGTTVGTFTANQASAATINVTVPTTVAALTDADNYATLAGDNDFSAGSVTVPNAITSNLATTLASSCTQNAVSLCDLLAVFDSLNRRINSVYDSLQRLNDELTALKSTIPPVTSAPTVSNVTSASMNVKANATSTGAAITSYEFCISPNSNMSGATCQTVQASDANNYTFTGLTPNTNYYVQYSATNFAGTTTSVSVLQRTPAHAPTATVSDPTAAMPAGFKVEVTGIDPKGKNDATTVQVCYKQSASCSVQENYDDYTCAAAQDVASVNTTNTQTITSLEPSTAYCVIVKVSNGDSTTIYGPYTVTTGNVPPTATAPSFQNVGSNSMTIKANNTSSTSAPITSYKYCYSTNPDMSGATCQIASTSTLNVTGLTANTTYYATVEATNLAGSTTSETANVRTPAHAPTATVSTSAKPAAGFKVEVTGIDPKGKNDATTVQVCYVLKGSGDCPDKESASYANCKTVNATGNTEATISVTGLTPSTGYCAIVKVSNGDSTTIYGPYTVTTGEDITMTVSQTGGGTISLCGASSVPVTYTATPSDGGSYTYIWSGTPASKSDNTATYSYTSASTYNVTVTATHTTEGYTVSATASTTVNSGGGPAVSIGFCEYEGVVSVVEAPQGSPNSISWGDGQTGTSVSDTTTHDYTALGTGSHSVTITASNASGCIFSRTMTVNVFGSGSTAADRTVKPCSVSASHDAQTGGEYTGNGHNNANHGLETVNGEGKITSVTDYDGNEYPVVQIGNQCWMAENLRVSHSPKTGSNIVVTAVRNYGSKMAAWYNNDQSTYYKAKRYGLLYNWCAAMDTARPSYYVEVATAANTNTSTSYQFNFTPSGNHQGVCPVGWHVPTDAEWNTMESVVNGSALSSATTYYRGSHAGKLSTGCDWSSHSNANAPGNYANAERNDSGFSAVPAGYFDSSIDKAGINAYFWSATQHDTFNAMRRAMGFSTAGVSPNWDNKYRGLSVRCVRD